MKFTALFAIFALVFTAQTPSAAESLLFCHFDNKAIDQPIGTGGPTVGEPVSVGGGIRAIVRDGPMPSPCLSVEDSTSAASNVRFEFLDGIEVSDGEIQIEATLRFHDVDNFQFLVRETGTASADHLNIEFYDDGSVWISDENGTNQSTTTYAAGPTYVLLIVFRFDAPVRGSFTGTYDAYLDSTTLAEGMPFTTSRGVGSFLAGCLNDSNTSGKFCIDNVTVTRETATSIDASVSTDSWGHVKSRWR